MLFNEPKLLKFSTTISKSFHHTVSVLFNEPKLLKFDAAYGFSFTSTVSVLFNEPKLLKRPRHARRQPLALCFSALQRAEIAETLPRRNTKSSNFCFSALQRAEIAETTAKQKITRSSSGFSALQRAEIAEIQRAPETPPSAALRFQCSSTSRNC